MSRESERDTHFKILSVLTSPFWVPIAVPIVAFAYLADHYLGKKPQINSVDLDKPPNSPLNTIAETKEVSPNGLLYIDKKDKNPIIERDALIQPEKIQSERKNTLPFSEPIPTSTSTNFLCPGIYYLTNIKNSKIYVGESINVIRRWKQHDDDLQKGTHHNHLLQRDFGIYGKQVFQFELIEPIRIERSYLLQKAILWAREIWHISMLKSAGKAVYNLTDGGGNFSDLAHSLAPRTYSFFDSNRNIQTILSIASQPSNKIGTNEWLARAELFCEPILNKKLENFRNFEANNDLEIKTKSLPEYDDRKSTMHEATTSHKPSFSNSSNAEVTKSTSNERIRSNNATKSTHENLKNVALKRTVANTERSTIRKASSNISGPIFVLFILSVMATLAIIRINEEALKNRDRLKSPTISSASPPIISQPIKEVTKEVPHSTIPATQTSHINQADMQNKDVVATKNSLENSISSLRIDEAAQCLRSQWELQTVQEIANKKDATHRKIIETYMHETNVMCKTAFTSNELSTAKAQIFDKKPLIIELTTTTFNKLNSEQKHSATPDARSNSKAKTITLCNYSAGLCD